MGEEQLIKYYFNNDNTLNLHKIVNDFSGYIFIIIKNITRNLLTDEDVEELISDVLLAVWKNKEKLDFEMPLKPYIAGIAKNIARNKLRSMNVTCDYLDSDEDIKSEIDIAELVESKETFEIISKELRKLGNDRKIFIMFYCRGMKIKQIGERLGYTEFNVSTKLHRIRKKIKQALERRGYYGK